MVLLLLVVLVPAVCLFWFMNAAMRNERFAARQKLTDVYRSQLLASQARLQQYWKKTAAELERLATASSPPAAFAKCVRSGLVDSVVLYDDQGRILYPNSPSGIKGDFGELESKWREADRLEHRRQYADAAKQFDALGRAFTNVHVAGRAFQAEARCLFQAGQREAVIELVAAVFSSERYQKAADSQGRLIVANAELLVLEVI